MRPTLLISAIIAVVLSACGPVGPSDTASAPSAPGSEGGNGSSGSSGGPSTTGSATGGSAGDGAGGGSSGSGSGGTGTVTTAGGGGGGTQWAHKMGGLGVEWTHDVGLAPDGSIVAFNVIGVRGESLEQVGFVHVGADGDEFDAQFENENRTTLHLASGSFVVDPAGSLVVAAAGRCAGATCPTLGGRSVNGGALVSLSPKAIFGWQAALPGDPISNVAVEGDGDLLVAAASSRPGVMRRFHPDGTLAWERGPVDPGAPASVAFGGDGDALLGNGATVSAFDRAGAKRWDRTFGGGAVILAVRTGGGTVLVLGRYASTFALAGVTLTPPAGSDHGYFVAQLASDGTPRWARDLGVVQETSEVVADPKALLAASADGAAVVVTGADACTAAVVSLDGGGTQRWRRPVAASGCGGRDLIVHSVQVAPSGAVVLGGAMAAPIDFGAGTLDALATDGFVVSLAP